MTLAQTIKRRIFHHRQTTLAGAIVATATIVGPLAASGQISYVNMALAGVCAFVGALLKDPHTGD